MSIRANGGILEIGILGGYSTIWMARALPAGGRLVTLEADPRHAEVAREYIVHAGLAEEVVDIRVGLALDTLPRLKAEGHEPFDLIFIDAVQAVSSATLACVKSRMAYFTGSAA